MVMRACLSPLTPAEREVADRNHWMVNRFLQSQQLPPDEWYDIVIFRYLLTVKNWFRRPDLYQYEFSTIAWYAMKSAIYNERCKQRRRVQTVSLDELVPNTNGLTWGDVVTRRNLDYIQYIRGDISENYI